MSTHGDGPLNVWDCSQVLATVVLTPGPGRIGAEEVNAAEISWLVPVIVRVTDGMQYIVV